MNLSSQILWKKLQTFLRSRRTIVKIPVPPQRIKNIAMAYITPWKRKEKVSSSGTLRVTKLFASIKEMVLNIITVKKKGILLRSMLFIHFCLPIIFNSFSKSQACSGRFVNPMTDICWSCLFPISIGPVKVSSGGREDTKNPSLLSKAPHSPCPRNPRRILGTGAPCRCDARSILYGQYGRTSAW